MSGQFAYANDRFLNSNYDGKSSKAFVEIHQTADGQNEMLINLPCDTKVISARFAMHGSSSISGDLELIEAGSGQCYLGSAPTFFIVSENEIQIITYPRIWTPGFDGIYTLERNE